MRQCKITKQPKLGLHVKLEASMVDTDRNRKAALAEEDIHTIDFYSKEGAKLTGDFLEIGPFQGGSTLVALKNISPEKENVRYML